MLTSLRLKILNFYRNNKWKIILFFIFWGILIVISQVLENLKNETPITTFNAYVPIVVNGETTPEKYQKEIEKMVSEYVNYCNKKE